MKKSPVKLLVLPIPLNDQKAQRKNTWRWKRTLPKRAHFSAYPFFTSMLIAQQQYRCLSFWFVFFAAPRPFCVVLQSRPDSRKMEHNKTEREKNDNSNAYKLYHVPDGKLNHFIEESGDCGYVINFNAIQNVFVKSSTRKMEKKKDWQSRK